MTYDSSDLDLQSNAIQGGQHPVQFDLTGDFLVDVEDRIQWVENLRGSYLGDWDLNGQFEVADLVAVFEAGKYGTAVSASWDEGDSNGDGSFDSTDIFLAFKRGGFESGPRVPASNVPEPTPLVLLMTSLNPGYVRRRRRT